MAQRLEHVRTVIVGAPSLRDFWRQVVEDWPEAELGSPVSYEAIRNYHFNRDAPVTYLVQVARVFGVRLEWLAAGQEPVQEAASEGHSPFADLYRDRATAEWGVVDAVLEHTRHDYGAKAYSYRAALWRFNHLLNHAEFPSAPWQSQGGRWHLLSAALAFMRSVDVAIEQSAQFVPEVFGDERDVPFEQNWSLNDLVLLRSGSPGWNAMWYDAVLALFARRVIGLGVRTPDNLFDSHEYGATAAAFGEGPARAAQRTAEPPAVEGGE